MDEIKYTDIFTPEQIAQMAEEGHAIVDETGGWDGVCYFIQKGKDGPIKIGFTLDKATRLKSLRTLHGKECKWLAERFGGRIREEVYHAQFAAHRLHGEWFAPHPDILAEIASINNGEKPERPPKKVETLSLAIDGMEKTG